jgi:putative proteasome-type protease
MTYCVGLQLQQGLVFASDSRTHAGVDYVTAYSKMHVFTPAPDRIFVLMAAGNLATTQEILDHIQRDLDYPPESGNLISVRYLFEAADYVGAINLSVQQQHGPALQVSGVSGEATLILGGQIKGQPPGLMLVYPQGNYINASPQTPYLQVGENKYGKPVLDRLVSLNMPLADGARLLIASLEATMRSNVTVGPPFEIAIYSSDALQLSHRLRFEADDPYFRSLQQAWNDGMRAAFDALPRFDWE